MSSPSVVDVGVSLHATPVYLLQPSRLVAGPRCVTATFRQSTDLPVPQNNKYCSHSFVPFPSKEAVLSQVYLGGSYKCRVIALRHFVGVKEEL